MSRLAQFYNYWQPDANLTPVTRYTVFDGGGFSDGTNPTGYTVGTAMCRDPATGRVHFFWQSGPTDPALFTTRYRYSDDRTDPAALSPITILATDPAHLLAWTVFGNCCLLHPSGRLFAWGGSAPHPGGSPWLPYVWYSDNPNAAAPTWVGPTAIAKPAGWGDFFPHGQPYVIGSEIWMPFYGKRTVDTNYSSCLMKSADGFTWTMVSHVTQASAGADEYWVEPTFLPLTPGSSTDLLFVTRAATPLWQTLSRDGGLTWRPRTRIGDAALVVDSVEPALYRCQDGSLLLFQGGRNAPDYDASNRRGIMASRSTDGGLVWGDQALLVALLYAVDYQSPFYMGLSGGKPRVGMIYSSDYINVDYLEIDEELAPQPLT